MKKVLVMLLVVIVALTGLAAGAYFYYHNNARQPMSDPSQAVSIQVEANESLYQILDRLEGEGLLKNAWLSKLYYRLAQSEVAIEPGRHEMPAGGSLKDLLQALQSKNLDGLTVTIPEGFTIQNIAQRMAESGLLSEEEFLAALKAFPAPAYVPDEGARRYRLEGFLRPATYTFTKGTPARDVIQAMSDAFGQGMAALVRETGKTIPLEEYDTLINKAAMIERETNVPDERALVASVIENRLAINMRLQLDATILYARGVDQKVITMEDINFENPYNTYYVTGLPLGPICCPSDDAIRAVLKPAQTDYLYYLLNPKTRRHFFTSDYAQFQLKREEYYGEASESNQPGESIPDNPYQGPEGLPFALPQPEPAPGSQSSGAGP